MKIIKLIHLLACVYLGFITFNLYAEEKPETVLIYAGTLIQIPGEAPKSEQTIVVEDGRVKEILTGYRSPGGFGADTGAKFIDLRDKFVLPGLIDAHVHLTIRHNDKRNHELITGEERLLEGIVNARTTLLSGFTTVRDVGADSAIIVLRDAIRDKKVIGPRVVAAGNAISLTGGHGNKAYDKNKGYSLGACDDVGSCRRAVRRQHRMGVDMIKITATGGGSSRNGGKDHAPAFFGDELEAIVNTAHSLDLKVAAHAHGTAGINAALNAGVDSIEHGSFLDEESIRLFKKNKSFLVPTLSVQDRIQEEQKTARGYMIDRIESFITYHPDNVSKAYKSGVKIAMGTDAGVVAHGKGIRELEWFVKVGMSEMDAIVSATVNAAELLGVDNEAGSLEKGKAADIIAVDENPLKDISNLWQVDFVMKNGIVYKSD